MQASTFLIAQISDLHLKSPNVALFGTLNPERALDNAIDCLKSLPQPPDLVLVTGDLANDGEPVAYRRVEKSLSDLAIPWLAIPGNHDTVAGFPLGTAAISERGPKLSWCFDQTPIRIIGLDSLVEGRSAGRLGGTQLDWLIAKLDEAKERPTILAVHHPPILTRIGGIDDIGLEDRDELALRIRDRANIVAIVSGHVHRTVIQRWWSTVVMIAPSLVNAVEFTLEPVDDPAWRAEPAGLMLHHLTSDGALTSHLLSVGVETERGRFLAPHGLMSDY